MNVQRTSINSKMLKTLKNELYSVMDGISSDNNGHWIYPQEYSPTEEDISLYDGNPYGSYLADIEKHVFFSTGRGQSPNIIWAVNEDTLIYVTGVNSEELDSVFEFLRINFKNYPDKVVLLEAAVL